MGVKCFYHDDMDGICSAQIVKMKYPDAECFSVDYEKGFPWEIIKSTDLVFMVDYGLQPFDKMVDLKNKCHLIWIDHHKTAINEYTISGIVIDGMRSLSMAGCELTWRYLFPEREIPIYVTLLADFDMWKNDDKDNWDDLIEPFEMGMLSLADEDVKPGGEIWNSLEKMGDVAVGAIVKSGGAIIKYLRKQNSDVSKKYAHGVMLDGCYFISLNTPHRGSQQLESVYDAKIHDGICVYRWTGKEYTFSLYSMKKEVDCGAIAKKYGGGGHPSAAGGKWTKEQFSQIFHDEN